MQQRIISRVIGNLVEYPAVAVHIADRYFLYSFLLLEPTKSGKK